MPLDFADEDIATNNATFEAARAKLTTDGWHAEPRYNTGSWSRIRFVIAELQEEIFEYEFRPMTNENVTQLA